MQRINICMNAARGLNYLHEHKVFHGDIKCSNVLLGQNWKAMIANLGLSKLVASYEYDTYDYATIVSGASRTEGYIDSEYSQILSKAYDIYSFGAVLFEVLCGRLAFINEEGEQLSVARLAKSYYKKGRLKEMIDVKLQIDQVDSDSLNMFSEIAYRCLERDGALRLSMGLVVKKLEEILKLQEILVRVQNVQHLKIPLKDILSATKKFDKNYLIGKGGYGEVYKAELKLKSKEKLPETANRVAIKRIFGREDSQGKEGFISELDVLSRCEHPNIVSLLGFCVEDDELLLVYELAHNGSLEDYLININSKINLSWAQRLKMSIDIAQGLKYIHTTMEDGKKIIHRDIKSANILLGTNWEPKIADFGLSKVHVDHGYHEISTINTTTIAGTDLYVDPEYARTGRLKKASDIYSLGVVLFEIFSGKLANDFNNIHKNEKGLPTVARRHFRKGTLKEILDPKVMEEAYELGFTGKVEPNQDSLDVFSRIAYQCVAKTQVERPKINVVIEELEKALHFQEKRIKTLKFSLEDIRSGVEDFNGNNCILKEGYGMLYKGTVKCTNKDKKVVVKRFSDEGYLNGRCSLSSEHCFLKEFEVLFKYKHENIIGLMGYCKEMNEKIIVYDHAPNGSLDKYLNDDSFSWTTRLKICIDIANGLKFLHEGDAGQDVVIHRDLKSSNILLNKDFKAKICGFELAFTYPTNQEIEYVIDNVQGSIGYSDPLFKETHFLTKESDIYTFGVMLFEILCGRLLAYADNSTDNSTLLDVLNKRHFQETPLDGMVFDGIKEQIGSNSLAIFKKIALQCLLHKREERPTASDVALQLQKALEFQEAYEIQATKLHTNDKEILLKSRETYSRMAKKDIFNILSKGILLKNDKEEIIRILQQTTSDREQEVNDVMPTTTKRTHSRRGNKRQMLKKLVAKMCFH